MGIENFAASTFKTAFEEYAVLAPSELNVDFLKSAAELISRKVNKDLDTTWFNASSSRRLALFSIALYFQNSKDFQRPGLQDALLKTIDLLLGDDIDAGRNIPEQS